jgi:hypothetical protein
MDSRAVNVVKISLEKKPTTAAVTPTAGVTRAVNESRIINATGVCELATCGKSFVKTVPNKRYCCEEHKIENWEKRTGKKWYGKKTV